jgi:hypothetical protein
MPTKEENFEVAKLAKLIGSQLNMIDRFSTEKPNMPANRIDMNKFVAQVTNPNQSFGNASGYVPEALVQKMVPDTSQFSNPKAETIPVITPTQPEVLPQPQVIPQPVQVTPTAVAVQEQPTNNVDINNNDISKFLERIATCLEKLVDYYCSRNIIDSDKKEILND